MNWIPLMAVLLSGGTTRAPLTCTVTPSVISMGILYEGPQMRIAGTSAPRSKIVIAIVGADRVERFKTAARFGPLWLEAGKVRITGVPSLFLRFSSHRLLDILSPGEIASRHLDEASVTARMRVEPPSLNGYGNGVIETNYAALKQKQGAYRFGNSGVILDDTGGAQRFTLQFHWPERAAPGPYELHVYEVTGGSIARETSVPISVVRAGFPAWISSMAENRGSLYGLVAVLISVIAGFGIDFITTRIFGKKRHAAH